MFVLCREGGGWGGWLSSACPLNLHVGYCRIRERSSFLVGGGHSKYRWKTRRLLDTISKVAHEVGLRSLECFSKYFTLIPPKAPHFLPWLVGRAQCHVFREKTQLLNRCPMSKSKCMAEGRMKAGCGPLQASVVGRPWCMSLTLTGLQVTR